MHLSYDISLPMLLLITRELSFNLITPLYISCMLSMNHPFSINKRKYISFSEERLD